MKKVFILLSIALLWGCASFEKKHYKAVKFFNENEVLAAEYCSGKFPVVPEFIKGDPIIKIDTVPKLIPYEVDCPDGTKVTGEVKSDCKEKTVTITDTIIQPDKAKERVLQGEIDKYKEMYFKEKARAENEEKERKELEKKFNQLLYTVLSALGLLALLFIIKIIRK